METSIIGNKTEIPDDHMLRVALGNLYDIWMEIRTYVFSSFQKRLKNGICHAKNTAGVSA